MRESHRSKSSLKLRVAFFPQELFNYLRERCSVYQFTPQLIILMGDLGQADLSQEIHLRLPHVCQELRGWALIHCFSSVLAGAESEVQLLGLERFSGGFRNPRLQLSSLHTTLTSSDVLLFVYINFCDDHRFFCILYMFIIINMLQEIFFKTIEL